MANMIDLKIRRKWFTDRASEGVFELDGVFECFSLEDCSRSLRRDMDPTELMARKVKGTTAIPIGRYRLVLEDSPKFGKDTLTILDVPAFDYIRIHGGNSSKDTEGCPLTGQTRTAPDDDWIGGSQNALKALKAKVVPRLKVGEEGWIEILEEPELDKRTVEVSS